MCICGWVQEGPKSLMTQHSLLNVFEAGCRKLSHLSRNAAVSFSCVFEAGCRKVRELLRLQWATTRGVEDNEVMPLLTEDLQRDLRRRLCVDLLKVVCPRCSSLLTSLHHLG